MEEQQNFAYCICSTAQINNMQPIELDDFEVELRFRVISGLVGFIIEFGEELGLFAVWGFKGLRSWRFGVAQS